ncbi:hypothetical protein [Burkholderia vietnamiensis]|uniref:hypothetical protein n=1 Tax=Burkholderia vietnamiensis TaxID=60552 RepID=UPI001B919E3F|nr:hypothetical protein [Burkholderia vietnamiensis]MBR8283917.1 hypothetical protein [Burkholderia vietnamiensis]
MMKSDTQTVASRLLDALDGASLSTDAGVQAVLYYIAAYPGQIVRDIAACTGFTEAQVEAYIAALESFITDRGPGYELNSKGEDVISGKYVASASLTPAQLARWEKIKEIVMDTVPSLTGPNTLRKLMENHFDEFMNSSKIGSHDKNQIEVDFLNQATRGITIHSPGTIPAIFFRNLKREYDLEEEDEQIIREALAAGLTFW